MPRRKTLHLYYRNKPGLGISYSCVKQLRDSSYLLPAYLSVRLSVHAINMLIAEEIPGDRNAIKIEAERIVKYKGGIIEIQCMWNVTAKVVPIIRGATGTISESFRQYLRNVDRKHEIKGIQKNSHIGHFTHTTESANVKVQNIFHGRSNIACSTNCKYRTAATLCTL